MAGSAESSPRITELLQRWQGGNRDALDELIPLVYDELRVIAARHLARERPDRTLQTTALVNEAYLKLIDQRRVDWQNRAHFFAIAARLMRRILLDDARRRQRHKRGADVVDASVDPATVDAAAGGALDPADVIAVDRALQELEQIDPTQGRIVELRFFGGLTVEETATALDLSPATVKREWAMAKAWLYPRVKGGGV
jgi:RNA polymerase sigma factor (TIGR02999 family)